MRILALIFLALPTPVDATSMELGEIEAAKNWMLRTAVCEDLREVFLVAPSSAGDMSTQDVAALMFASTYIEGVADARNMRYSDLLVEWGRFCKSNPNTPWREYTTHSD